MKIIYITAEAPYGREETFIIDEMNAVKKAGVILSIIPRNPTKEAFHDEAQTILSDTIQMPVISIKMFFSIVSVLLLNIKIVLQLLGKITLNSYSIINLAKNIAVFPKGLYVSQIAYKKKIHHIHAHWSLTTSTIAYIASELTGIPWSFTVHSGMILKNNMIKEKLRTASFVRVISANRYKDILRIAGSEYINKVFVIHMGIHVPPYNVINHKAIKRPVRNIIGCIGHLDRIKGQVYLVEACYRLKQMGVNVKCLFIGEGNEKNKIQMLIEQLKLNDEIKLLGEIPHSKVLGILRKQSIDVLVLPSITLPLEKRAEGIPVSLMEAMANGVPVISTNTGAISELLGNDSGILVNERNSHELAEAIMCILADQNLRERLIFNGYEKVKSEFNLEFTTRKLVQFISNHKKRW